MHKITLFEDDMRKILSQEFWSHGTLLGSIGPVSQQDADERFSKSQILVKWGPYNCSVIVACREQAKKPNLASSLAWNVKYFGGTFRERGMQCAIFHPCSCVALGSWSHWSYWMSERARSFPFSNDCSHCFIADSTILVFLWKLVWFRAAANHL